jgi:WD40 repeat protein
MKVQRAVPVMALFLACSAWGQKPELVVETGHAHDVTSVAFSPKGKIVASGDADGAVALWDVATGHELLDLGDEGSKISTVAFSPDGTILASAGKDINFGTSPRDGTR